MNSRALSVLSLSLSWSKETGWQSLPTVGRANNFHRLTRCVKECRKIYIILLTIYCLLYAQDIFSTVILTHCLKCRRTLDYTKEKYIFIHSFSCVRVTVMFITAHYTLGHNSRGLRIVYKSTEQTWHFSCFKSRDSTAVNECDETTRETFSERLITEYTYAETSTNLNSAVDGTLRSHPVRSPTVAGFKCWAT